MKAVGRIQSVFRYPVKSMGGQSLGTSRLGWHGLEGDRRFAFRRIGVRGGFPWLTATRLPELVSYRVEDAVSDPSARSGLRVIAPDGEAFALDAPALSQRLSVAHGAEVDFMHLKHGIFDEASVSLISAQTIAHLGSEAGTRLDPRRFRPNLLLDTFEDEPYAEDAWVGRRLVIGSSTGAALWLTQRDPRCAIVNLDPDTAAAEPKVLETIVRSRRNLAGIYGATVRPGEVSPGATVYLAA